jgi:hypothetical protein
MVLAALAVAAKVAILLVATVVFLALYSWLSDLLERRGP